ncbi:MAG TPA: efflux RND transporter periplasmic adaptor subunit [Solimonas sp.]|nr:efflux RND transporter periplasmic adaptor subunit [Solimonas sp.]
MQTAVGLGGILLLLSLTGCDGPDEAPAEAATALSVEVVSAVRENWPDLLAASGEVAPWQEASIGAEVGGVRLDEVLVNVGDTVKKGQLLARYNEDTLRADLARADAMLAEAAARNAQARADAERADRLESSEAMTRQTIQSFRTTAAAAEAQLASARAQRDTQALKLRYARVLAPDDGVISARNATVGAVSGMGTELFRLLRRSRLEWRAEVPGAALARLAPGMQAEILGLDGTLIAGKLRQLSPMVDTGTRNGLAYVDLPAGSGIAAGMYLSGKLVLPGREALVLPESAVVLRDGNHYLMKIDAQNRVQEIKVQTGRRRQQAIEILADLGPADRFVKSGGAFLNAGDLVQVIAAAAAKP